MKKHRNPCPQCGRRGKPNNIGIYSCEQCLTWWTKPIIEDHMKIDPKKVIKTEPKMIKEGIGLPDLFLLFLFIVAIIQIVIQVIV